MAPSLNSEPKIRLGTRVIDFAVLPEAQNSKALDISPPPLSSPKEIGTGLVMPITYLGLFPPSFVLISPL